MAVQPSNQDQQHGLGSWHPAMRPNVHEHESGGERQMVAPIAVPTASKDTNGEAAVSNEARFRPNHASQDQPLSNPHQADDLQPTQPPGNSGVAAGGDVIPSQINGTTHTDQDWRQREVGKCLGEQTCHITSERTTWTNVAESHQASGDTADGLARNTLQEIRSADVIEDEYCTMSSTVAGSSKGALGDQAEMDRVWEQEERNMLPDSKACISRTNSFPMIPLAQGTKSSLPQSQAEVTMKGEETTETPRLEFSRVASPSDIPDNSSPVELLSSAVDEDREFPTSVQNVEGISSTNGDDEVSRYEEGVPLVSAVQSEGMNSLQDQKESTEAESPNAVDMEGDFFDKTLPVPSNGMSNFKPSPPDRKSTTEVLNSMRYAPHSTNHTEPEIEEDQPSLAGTSGGDSAVPPDTVRSQAITKQDTANPDFTSRDDDLTDMWKAVLGEDDLLEVNEASVDPSAFFEDDGEGFLQEDQGQQGASQSQPATFSTIEPIHSSDKRIQGPGRTEPGQAGPQDQYLPATGSHPSPYLQSAHPTSAVPNSVSATIGTSETMRQPFLPPQAVSRPQMPPSTQSFADKSKGGYTSPYDLPMDVTRPKKRTAYQQMRPNSDIQQSSNRPPPPRSSSMFTGAPPPIDSHPPVPRLPSAYSPTNSGQAIPPAPKPSTNMGGFFEELPMTKSRPSSSMGRYAPPVPQPVPIPPSSSPLDTSIQSLLSRSASSNAAKASQQYELLPPERMGLYGNTGQAEPVNQNVPATSARYSPAPKQSSNVPPPRNRYAASPSTSSRPPPPQTLPFQPRTSSPLAQNHFQPQQLQEASVSDPSHRRPQSSGKPSLYRQDTGASSFPSSERRSSPSLSTSSQHEQAGTSVADSSYALNTPDSDHVSLGGLPSLLQNEEVPPFPSSIAGRVPPRRSQTQSPGAGKYAPQIINAESPYQRPASVNHQASYPSSESVLPPGNQLRPRGRTLPKEINYIKPTDGRELDHLERWKGCPIISFGFGGAIVTSFPKQIPRYASGQAAPMMKCSPGEVKLQDGKILPLEEDIATFPGPLKSKGKKKDVMDWLQRRISRLENDIGALASSPTLPNPIIRHEEKIILWKIMRILVEHDGMLDSNLSANTGVRSTLSPELTQGDSATIPAESSNASLLGIKRHGGPHTAAEPSNPGAMEETRKILLHGEREKAVWHAVDNRLWAHAMLLASTLDQGIWKQVSQEFVRQEVKTYGTNTEALAALYQIFAGNWEESADELVPPSARAGLQLVSKTASAGPTKNAIDGLHRWRETLTLILSNRTSDDAKALLSLGRLLASYGRTEAAHVCYVFANTPQLFGGPEDPQISVALLGADHIEHPFDYGRDVDSILLTEVYDFARTVLSSSSVATVSPHLQSFKLYHAMILAEYGYKAEAQQYCEIITNTLNSTTKRSPYYHPLLLEALNSLMERLRQAPRDNSGSWISKPSIDKVSSSIWAKFNQYVAGDESDAASTGSGKGHDPAAGPFAGVTGDSPTLSRTPSSNDLYNSYAPGISSVPTVNSSNPRYAPSGLYTPRSSLEQHGRPVQDFQRPLLNDSLRPAMSQQQYQSRPNSSTSSNHDSYKPTAFPSANPARTQSYLPTPPSQPDYVPVPSPDELSSALYEHGNDESTQSTGPQALQGSFQPQLDPTSINGLGPSPLSYNPEPSAYEPPSMGSYDPPSYSGDAPPAEDSLDEQNPKKKSYLDDDEEDDFEARAAAIRREEKARKDREAEEAFRRAAEADGKRTLTLIS